MTSEPTEEHHRPTLLLIGIVALAAALRLYRLGDWGFEATEIFTLRDSVDLRPRNPRPLMYLLNHYLIGPIHPLDELGLRILPALFGVLAVLSVYLLTRRVAGERAGLFSALLMACSGVLVYYSQFARYWTLVFLLSSVYPVALYIGIRERQTGALILGLVTAVLAMLAHPVSVLPMGGLGVWLLVTYSRRENLSRIWRLPAVRWGALVTAALAAVIALRFVPLLRYWVFRREPATGGEFLLHVPAGPGFKQLAYLLGYLDALTLPLALAAAAGLYLIWKQDRPLALFLISVAAFPICFLLLVSIWAAVSLPYMFMPTAWVFFIGAGVFLDRVSRIDRELRPRWLMWATVAAIIIAAGLPTLVSQYRDGRRYDLRAVARWLDPRLSPEDLIFSDQSRVLHHYLPAARVLKLTADPAELNRWVSDLRQSGGGTLWIVMPAPSHAFRTNPRIGGLNGWVYENCQLRNTVGVGRLDFRQQYLQVYRCPPAPADAPGLTT